MPPLRDLTGQKFGRLLVIARAESRSRHVYWRCKCDCGNEIETRIDNLTSGGSQSCGCFNREQSSKKHRTHGESDTRLYALHKKIKSRCMDSKNDRFSDYGGRGITMCPEWLDSYVTFRDWALANGYRDDLTIDRRDVNGPYSPENCRWITNQEQQNNRRDNHYITYNGQTRTITEWARIYNLSENGLVHRIRRGWDVERAFHTPMQEKKKRTK